jgi:hypothetical protein
MGRPQGFDRGRAKVRNRRFSVTQRLHLERLFRAPNRSLVAGNRDGEKCSRAVIEPGTASRRYSWEAVVRWRALGDRGVPKETSPATIIMADGSYRTV